MEREAVLCVSCVCPRITTISCAVVQEDYSTDEDSLTVPGVKGGAGGILDLLKASKQVAGLDSALR